jgi:lipopolysaccharide biosynthesis glycosyltransferase
MKQSGAFLHRFQWLEDNLIGELDPQWNWLVTEYPDNKSANLLHYTLGTPCFKDYQNSEMAELWYESHSKSQDGMGS